ncbi:MAG: hypothetical protein SFU86_22010 [Pirellulaceae bacterium]|nr:hypothetical protein [Pirellulaceae bacterium]
MRRITRNVVLVLAVLFLAGCTPPTAQQKMTGTWKATPRVDAAVNEAVDMAAQGQKVNPLAEGAAKFFGNAFASAALSCEVEFKATGTVFFRGNTDALGVPPDSDGKWEATSTGADTANVKLTAGDKQISGSVVFRDKDEFTLKFESVTVDPATKAETKVPTSIVFKRIDS